MVMQSFTTRADWLEAKRHGIGGSDAPNIIPSDIWPSDEKRFGEPRTVYADKIAGYTEGRPQLRHELGHLFEPIVADLVEKRTGLKVSDPGDFSLFTNSERTWQMCTPDRFIFSTTVGEGALSIKTTHPTAAYMWDDGPPLAYRLQLQHELDTLDLSWGMIAVLVGTDRFLTYDVVRDESFAEGVRSLEELFWTDNVLARIEPASEANPEVARRTFLRLHPDDNGSTVELPAECEAFAKKIETHKANIKELQRSVDTMENAIREAIGDATYGIVGDVRYSLKTQNRSGYIVEPSKTRILRRVKK